MSSVSPFTTYITPELAEVKAYYDPSADSEECPVVSADEQTLTRSHAILDGRRASSASPAWSYSSDHSLVVRLTHSVGVALLARWDSGGKSRYGISFVSSEKQISDVVRSLRYRLAWQAPQDRVELHAVGLTRYGTEASRMEAQKIFQSVTAALDSAELPIDVTEIASKYCSGYQLQHDYACFADRIGYDEEGVPFVVMDGGFQSTEHRDMARDDFGLYSLTDGLPSSSDVSDWSCSIQ